MTNEEIRDLLDAWDNGNRKHVADTLVKARRADVARFVASLPKTAGFGNAETLISMLETRETR